MSYTFVDRKFQIRKQCCYVSYLKAMYKLELLYSIQLWNDGLEYDKLSVRHWVSSFGAKDSSHTPQTFIFHLDFIGLSGMGKVEICGRFFSRLVVFVFSFFSRQVYKMVFVIDFITTAAFTQGFLMLYFENVKINLLTFLFIRLPRFIWKLVLFLYESPN